MNRGQQLQTKMANRRRISLDLFVEGTPLPEPKKIRSRGHFRSTKRDWLERTDPLTGRKVRVDVGRAKRWTYKVVHLVRAAMKENGMTVAPRSSSFTLGMRFYLPRPDSVKREHHTVTPDLDNFAYLVTNALKKVVYFDDSQVTYYEYLSKNYSSSPDGAWEVDPGLLLKIVETEVD